MIVPSIAAAFALPGYLLRDISLNAFNRSLKPVSVPFKVPSVPLDASNTRFKAWSVPY